ncbi:hypothetical protein CP967_22980 [Streptomyces nitrosporeus]|uniref:Uncharacterized protein n=1 Tax=Streptomyces nitrosporeus TaxID=28894 RepID=A0A5J6FD44_9ACTN|nr:hypothetical protein [Streptomyces nitrosporeus]QEU74469.1 hypothetical protein CP967_22980 [Streptomyces nitrosporeus]GGY83301.1 hypothetical protein GCM10010327_11920 [Streptomyces nitrosporeus]
MPASAQLLFSALSKQVPGPMDPAPTDAPPMISELPLAEVSLLAAGEPGFAETTSLCGEPPLTSEPPLADATPLTSEPPLAAVAPLTSEPTVPGTAGGMESPGV